MVYNLLKWTMASNLNKLDFLSFIKDSDILKKYGIVKIGFFGSLARGEESNDIDILISEFSNYKNLIKLKYELESINQIINFEIHQGTFDIEELNAAKNSYFYRHIDFSVIT